MTFSEWFEGKGGSRGSIERLWDPIAYALGFIDCDHISARCMLTIFQASKRCVWNRGGGIAGVCCVLEAFDRRWSWRGAFSVFRAGEEVVS